MKYRDCQLMKTNEKDTHQRIVPALRFPDFQSYEGWKLQPLSTYLTEHRLKSDGKSEVHSVSVSQGIVNQKQYLGRSFAAENTSHYKLVKPYDIVYTKSPTGEYPYGIVKQNLNKYNVIVSPLYGVFSPNNLYIGYIIHSIFESPIRLNNYLISIIQKGAKNTIQISNDAFLSKDILLPSDKKEQQKIADCLSSIDSLIKATEDKIVLLKAHKKGLMQQLFPAEGETTPKLRFPEFQNAGEWESHPITKFFTRLTSRNTDNNTNILTISAQHGLVSQREYFNKVVAAENISNYFLLHKGDFAYNKSSSQDYPQGVIKCLKLYEIGIVSPLYICMKIKDTNEISFFEQYFESGMINPEIKKIAQEGARNHGLLNVSIKDFFNTVSLIVPRSIEERKKIADCLSSIDMLINVTEDKIALLKAHKKGLMQQLFPNTNNCEV